MARSIHKLTALAVTRAKAPGYYSDGGGLFLRVGPFGAKSWAFRYKVVGKTREMGLGPTHTIGLAEARQKAQDARKLRLDGIDPLDARRAARSQQRAAAAKALSFRDAGEQYITAHRAGWAPRHTNNWLGSLRDHVYPVIGDIGVADLETAHVVKVIEPIWTEKTETANRVRGRIEAILGWATTAGYRGGDNPARWKGHLENLLPKPAKVRAPVKGHTALPYQQIAEFMADLRQREGQWERALEFAVLTAARAGEVLGAEWSEIDLAERVWIVPPERMKAGREHRVALSDAAVTLLEALPRIGSYVFSNEHGRRLAHTALLRVITERMGRRDCTVHGFRSTFSTWAAERTAYSFEVREMALAHAVGSRVERVYQRGEFMDQRRRLMDAWATFCSTPIQRSGEVVAIGRTA